MTVDRKANLPPSIDDIAAMAQAVLDGLPEPFAGLIAEIPIQITEWADAETLAQSGIDDPLGLTGLYRGTPIGERSAMLPPGELEMIQLFRMPILFEWLERQVPLDDVVFDVLTHEIGHHFGMDEEAVLRMEGRLP